MTAVILRHAAGALVGLAALALLVSSCVIESKAYARARWADPTDLADVAARMTDAAKGYRRAYSLLFASTCLGVIAVRLLK